MSPSGVENYKFGNFRSIGKCLGLKFEPQGSVITTFTLTELIFLTLFGQKKFSIQIWLCIFFISVNERPII